MLTPHPCHLLAIGAHPDDVELNAGGTILKAKSHGLEVAVCHLTDGEMGTRGSSEIRTQEAQLAAKRLGVDHLSFLHLEDGHVTTNKESKMSVVRMIRTYQPQIILAPFWQDLHPDHAATGEIVKQANFLAGLERIETDQGPWRARSIFYYMSHTPMDVSIVVDISEELEAKKEAAMAYESQFHQEASTERQTFISGENFWQWWEGRASYWGHHVGVKYGEPFHIDGPIPFKNPFDLFSGFGKYKNQ